MKTLGWVCCVVFGSISALGCGSGAGVEPDTEQSASALAFASRAELYQWIVAEADRIGASDVVVRRDAKGEIESIQLPGDSKSSLLAKLHGSAGYFELEGQRITLPGDAERRAAESGSEAAPVDPGEENLGSSSAALTSGIPSSRTECSGSFCVYGSSWNRHYSLFGLGYHDVGGSASSNGHTTTYSALVRPDPGCGTRVGCSAPQYYCEGEDHLEVTQQRTSWATVQTIATCYKSAGFAAVTNTYFSNMSNCGSGHCQSVPAAVTSGSSFSANWIASQSLWAIGYFTLPCTNSFGPAECYIDGVCSSQFAMGPGGSASTRTAAGSYDCQ